MRIISGSARGRRLLTPKNDRIRPTADRVKESLFNILTVMVGNLAERRVLDVFAGTGNLGIEALSRGAVEAVFVDENREAAALVKKNLELTGLAGRGRVLQMEALSALRSLEKQASPFGLVFLDPPYRQGLSGQILEFLASSALIDETSLVVIETAAREELPDRFGRLGEFDRRVYGDTAIAFFTLLE
ncbi:MAG TPA: 16S rRNA (guanine(966)-N(2))-methyltransferase RsmD [Geobacteraceae bacterium]